MCYIAQPIPLHIRIFTPPYRTAGLRGKFDLGSANTPTGVAAVIYCTGYMVADQVTPS